MEDLLLLGPTPPSFIPISILQVSLHPPENCWQEVLVRSLSKVIAVNARGQEGSISETLLEIFKTSGRRRSPGVELPVQRQDTGRLINCNKNKV